MSKPALLAPRAESKSTSEKTAKDIGSLLILVPNDELRARYYKEEDNIETLQILTRL
jgi:hypothetical protein